MNEEKSKLKEIAEQMNAVVLDLIKREQTKIETEKKLRKAKDTEKRILLLGKDEKQFHDDYFADIKSGFDRMEQLNEELNNALRTNGGIKSNELTKESAVPSKTSKEYKQFLSKKERKEYLASVNIEDYLLKDFAKEPEREKVTVKEEKFTVYKTTSYSRLSNSFCEGLSEYFIKRYPNFFKKLYDSLKISGMKYLSKTYVSMIFFTSFLVSFWILVLSFLMQFRFGASIINAGLRSVVFAFIAFIITFVIVYYYPNSVASSKRKKIKADLPFVIIHMATVAGSGAQPIAMFNLVLSSGEYKGMEDEIKKIINYVNLYGYDLSTAMRAVSITTPSPEFKELLTGITATIESGGDIKAYLKGKADSAVSTYITDRKKYVESLGAYSDIYTGLAIAAPLLFMVTLAIINTMGGKLGGLSIKTLSSFGVYGGIPLLNILFLIFLEVIKPE